jgi:hypothetical protein
VGSLTSHKLIGLHGLCKVSATEYVLLQTSDFICRKEKAMNEAETNVDSAKLVTIPRPLSWFARYYLRILRIMRDCVERGTVLIANPKVSHMPSCSLVPLLTRSQEVLPPGWLAFVSSSLLDRPSRWPTFPLSPPLLLPHVFQPILNNLHTRSVNVLPPDTPILSTV